MDTVGHFRLVVPQAALDAFVAHARAELPNESCGFFAGRVEAGAGRVTVYLPLVNGLASPVAFATEPRSVLSAFRTMRATGTEVLAVCHSHPTSPAVPSRRDITHNTYGPTVAWVIIRPTGDHPEIRSWWLSDVGYEEGEWETAPDRD